MRKSAPKSFNYLNTRKRTNQLSQIHLSPQLDCKQKIEVLATFFNPKTNITHAYISITHKNTFHFQSTTQNVVIRSTRNPVKSTKYVSFPIFFDSLDFRLDLFVYIKKSLFNIDFFFFAVNLGKDWVQTKQIWPPTTIPTNNTRFSNSNKFPPNKVVECRVIIKPPSHSKLNHRNHRKTSSKPIRQPSQDRWRDSQSSRQIVREKELKASRLISRRNIRSKRMRRRKGRRPGTS